MLLWFRFNEPITATAMFSAKLNNKKSYALYILLVALLFTGCADVTLIEECTTVAPYGFWGGLWHGIVAPFAFIGSLFSDDIAMYTLNNNGGWYDFGFVLGAGILFGGGGIASK